MRTANISRSTAETDINLWINLDGDGNESEINSGVGFLDHMLTLFSCHSGIQMNLTCQGDTWVDDHHSVEDIGIALGDGVKEAIGNKKGIMRYASLRLPMDESLVEVDIDISGRGGCYATIPFPSEKIGTFDTELVSEFLTAYATHAGITLHVREICGANSHHIAEACFKGLGRAMRTALSTDERFKDQVPSTKGVL